MDLLRLANLILGVALAAAAGGGAWLAANPDTLEDAAEVWLERDSGSNDRATALLRQALAADPASPYRWCTLGEELAHTGQAQTAAYCFGRAMDLAPNVPPVLMRVANFHFASGRNEEGLRYTHRVLDLVREYDAVVFSTWDRMSVPLPAILAEGLPPEAADGYCEFLLARGDYPAAAAVWAERAPGYRKPNLVFNGGFESEFASSGLDWKSEAADGARAERTRGQAHSGAWSLRVEFDGTGNLAYRHVAQRVVVTPGNLRFRAFVRTERLGTDQGIRFRIVDAEDPTRLDTFTAQAAGTSGWTPIAAKIAVRASTRLVRVEVIREPSLKFDSRIRGTAWIDDVELTLDR